MSILAVQLHLLMHHWFHIGLLLRSGLWLFSRLTSVRAFAAIKIGVLHSQQLYICFGELDQPKLMDVFGLGWLTPSFEHYEVARTILNLNLGLNTAHDGEFNHLLEKTSPPLAVGDLTNPIRYVSQSEVFDETWIAFSATHRCIQILIRKIDIACVR